MKDELKSNPDYEIDLFEFFETLWNGKLKIISFAFFSLVVVIGYQNTLPPEKFLAITQIKPIGSIEGSRYTLLNSMNTFKIDADRLLSLYLEELEKRKVFEDAIRKFNLLESSGYDDENIFNADVISLASKIEVLTPTDNKDTKLKSVAKRFSTINFQFNDKKKWKEALVYVNKSVTESVQKNLQLLFLEHVKSSKINKEFLTEDAKLALDNAIEDQKLRTEYKLAFLKEQAIIARTLGIEVNTLEALSLSKDTMMTNMAIAPPFYFRGYVAIEKETELIENRQDSKAFIPNFLELEGKLRKVEQDNKINKTESMIAQTPIYSGNNFSAASVSVESTDFTYESNRTLIKLLAILFGGIIGSLYVLINKYKK